MNKTILGNKGNIEVMESLQELSKYIRSTIPAPKALLQLKANERAGGISFIWHGTEFFVKITLQTFEVRGNTLYITGLSTLLQAVLTSRRLNEKKLGTIVDQLTEVEILAQQDPRMRRKGIETLSEVRESLEQMVGKPSSDYAPRASFPKPLSVGA